MEKGKIVPDELRSFICEEGGNSLLVKGETGTGKTTLALKIMENFYGIVKSDYISKRVGNKKLFKQFPWLKKKMKQNNIVSDARKLLKSFYSNEIIDSVSIEEVKKTQTYLSRRLLDDIYEKEENFSLKDEELKKLEGKVERGEIIGDEEMSDSFKNEFVFEIGKTLPEIDKAYEMVERNLPEKSLIIIDSIEALSDHYGIPKEKIISTLQKDLADNGNTNLIFITEKNECEEIDFIVDGIIELDKRSYKNNILRSMKIKKLKGKKVENTCYSFTLHGGDFRIIETKIPGDFTRMKKEPILVDDAGKISTGQEKIDDVIGGLKLPGSHIIEVGEYVPKGVLKNILSAILSNSCVLERGTVTLPPFGFNSRYIEQELEGYIPEDKMKNLLILQQYLTENDGNIMRIRGKDFHSDFDLDKIENKLHDSRSPYTFLIGLNSVFGIYGEKSVPKLNNMISTIISEGHSFVGFSVDNNHDLSELKVTADDILKLEKINDMVCFYSEKKQGPLHSLSFRVIEGNPVAEVTPIE